MSGDFEPKEWVGHSLAGQYELKDLQQQTPFGACFRAHNPIDGQAYQAWVVAALTPTGRTAMASQISSVSRHAIGSPLFPLREAFGEGLGNKSRLCLVRRGEPGRHWGSLGATGQVAARVEALVTTLEVVARLHDQGMCFGSLNPEWIVAKKGGWALNFFGATQVAELCGGAKASCELVWPVLRAPEQQKAIAMVAGPWTDVYQAGVLTLAAFEDVAIDEHTSLEQLQAGTRLPEGLKQAVAACLAQEVASRAPDLGPLLGALRQANVRPAAATAATASTPRPSRSGAGKTAPLNPYSAPVPTGSASQPGHGQPPYQAPGAVQGHQPAGPAAPQQVGQGTPPNAAAAPVPTGANYGQPHAPTHGQPSGQPAPYEAAPSGHATATSQSRPRAPLPGATPEQTNKADGPPASLPPGSLPPEAQDSRIHPAIFIAIGGGLVAMAILAGALFLVYRTKGGAGTKVSGGPKPTPSTSSTSGPPPTTTPAPPPTTAAPPATTPAPTGSAPTKTPSLGLASLASPAPFTYPADSKALLPISERQLALGTRRAKATMVVFGDLDCPHTKRLLRELKGAFGHVSHADPRVVFYPISVRPVPHSKELNTSLLIVRARKGQAPAWRFISKALLGPGVKDTAEIDLLGKQVGLRAGELKHAIKADAAKKELAAANALAARLEVRSTPTIFINGKRLVGYVPPRALRTALRNGELKAKRALRAGRDPKQLYSTLTYESITEDKVKP